MHRRFLCLLLIMLLLISTAARADLATKPTRDRFSLAYDRLEMAIKRERPVTWRASVTPVVVGGYLDGALEIIIAMLSSLELSGSMLAFQEGGGHMQTSIHSGGHEIASFGQYMHNDRTAINLTGDWIAFQQGMEYETAAMLDLDPLATAMLTMDYESFRQGDMPFISPLIHYGKRLWALASPYARDNHGLSVPSGQTGHGTSYEIDTHGLRTILGEWLEELTPKGLSLGLAGSDLSLGVTEEGFEAFCERMRRFAGSVELSKPLKFSLAFGEGDLLGIAKGSGTLREDGKTTGVSYTYSCTQSSTRTSRKYSLDFQPRTMDTIVLSASHQTSSNNKTSGEENFSLKASGTFDGQPYRIRIDSNMVNKYGLADDGLLTENITGKLTATIEYGGETIADITVNRNGLTHSYVGLTRMVTIEDNFDVLVTNGQGTLFEGVITLGFDVIDGVERKPDILNAALNMEEMDFIALERLRDSMRTGLTNARQVLIQALPASAMNVLFNQR